MNTIGEIIGLNQVTYKAYELGARSLPSRIAVQLMLLYGVDPDSITKKSGIPKDIAGKPYSKSSFDTWPGERIYDEETLPRIIQRLTDRLIRMLLAARRANRFTLALQMLDECLAEMQHDLLLEEHCRVLSDKKLPFEKWNPIKVYVAGAPVRQPEMAEFPLAQAALRTMQDLMDKRKVCLGRKREDFDEKELKFFSHRRR